MSEDPVYFIADIVPWHPAGRSGWIPYINWYYPTPPAAVAMADEASTRSGSDIERTVNEVLGDMAAGRTSKGQAQQIKDGAERRIKNAEKDDAFHRATRFS